MGFVGLSKRPESQDSESLSKKKDTINIDSRSISDVESGSSNEEVNPFKDPVVADHYRKLYEKSKYECAIAFDPEFEWTQEEEKALIRKLDYRVALTSCILFFGLQVDRGNLAQAVADNLLKDLHLTTNDYNLGNTLFLVSFLLAEIPSQLISKALGPDIFIPIQMVSWSLVAMLQGAMKNKTGFLITRVLIGALEGGFIADLVLWISYFYKSKELPIRLSFFWTTLSLTQIATSLLAFGILRMRGILGLAGWRWLFIIEGGVTLLVGLWGFHAMVPSAVETKRKFNPKGWFTEREEKIVVNRVLRDDPSKGDMNNRQALSPKMIWKAFMDYDLWPIYMVGFLVFIPKGTVQPYMTLTLKQLGFSTFNVNLLTIPQYVIHIIFLLVITWLSEKVNERALVSLALPVFALPFLAALRWWPGSMHQPWPTWFLVSMVLSSPYIHAICVSWVSRNSNSIRSRSVCSALYNMFVQLGNIAANNIYRADDKPLYKRGNQNLVAVAAAAIPLLILVKVYYVWRNNQRDKIWNAMSYEEQEAYLTSTTDEGNKRLDFRFDH
ncbi:hypothetical protein JCM33374_g6570 [Metschnikowia sp. JCM 33374]|nr:hypothetical protein JCM33374_g6570 [Metschnikowia sp. JCM 33374]